MKKIVFTLALLALLTVVAFASISEVEPNYKQQSAAKAHKNHHTHIVVPVDHYSM
jgi:uncharacterized alpha/beta hydrolase family protein